MPSEDFGWAQQEHEGEGTKPSGLWVKLGAGLYVSVLGMQKCPALLIVSFVKMVKKQMLLLYNLLHVLISFIQTR